MLHGTCSPDGHRPESALGMTDQKLHGRAFKQSGIAMRNGNGPRGSPCWRRKRPIWHSVVAEPVLQERRQNISVVNSRKNKNGSRFWSRMTCPAFANLHSITAQNHLGRPVQQMEDLEAANISGTGEVHRNPPTTATQS
uniref:(northern house mosquito) hypothetical protein n=2 Tax=Culex pipiens TaxID=7175 RepID=A0A8D8C9I0_CULPI